MRGRCSTMGILVGSTEERPYASRRKRSARVQCTGCVRAAVTEIGIALGENSEGTRERPCASRGIQRDSERYRNCQINRHCSQREVPGTREWEQDPREGGCARRGHVRGRLWPYRCRRRRYRRRARCFGLARGHDWQRRGLVSPTITSVFQVARLLQLLLGLCIRPYNMGRSERLRRLSWLS